MKSTKFLIVLLYVLISSCNYLSPQKNKENTRTNQEMENEYLELRDYFGLENLRMDLQQEVLQDNNQDSIFIDESKIRYGKVRITHIPSGKIVYGTSHTTAQENQIEALKKLKTLVKGIHPNNK